MSELITSPSATADFRWQLLTTVSAVALCGSVFMANAAKADGADSPTVWIELGGQLERMSGQDEPFAPAFTLAHLGSPFNVVSPLVSQQPPRYAVGGEGKISLEPKDTDWVFAAGLRYGRSNSSKHIHQQTVSGIHTHRTVFGLTFGTGTQLITRGNDTVAKHQTSHLIVDFTAGKDVGLGMFSRGTPSVFGIGIRYAQFASESAVTLRSFPDFYYPTRGVSRRHHHSYYGRSDISHGFAGVGPSLSLSGSSPIIGNVDEGEIVFDWGGNAALLFGRQKVRGTHKTVISYFQGTAALPVYRHTNLVPADRSRSVITPNVGGFAGLTFQHEAAKVSFGYRADFFFGAIDGGIDTRKSEAVGFYGPFATISIGLGDR